MAGLAEAVAMNGRLLLDAVSCVFQVADACGKPENSKLIDGNHRINLAGLKSLQESFTLRFVHVKITLLL